MKIFLLITLSVFLLQNAFGYEYPYNPLDKSFKDKEGSVIEVQESTPIKSQDGIGICYGFSSTSLLENFRCREMQLDCSDPKEALSSFDVTSYFTGGQGLRESGDSSMLLEKFQKSNHLIAREQCIPYTSLVHQINKNKRISKNEGNGWDYLTSKWEEYKGTGKKSNDCATCLANDIKKSLVNLKTPAEQLNDAFLSATSMEDFLYKAILPKECLAEANAAKIPAFKVNTFPEHPDSKLTTEALAAKIEEVLTKKIPLEISICADKSYSENCDGNEGHSISLFGIKEVCQVNGDCRKMVKVKNSYGKSWQDKTNNGWIDLEEVAKSSNTIAHGFRNLVWLTKP